MMCTNQAGSGRNFGQGEIPIPIINIQARQNLPRGLVIVGPLCAVEASPSSIGDVQALTTTRDGSMKLGKLLHRSGDFHLVGRLCTFCWC